MHRRPVVALAIVFTAVAAFVAGQAIADTAVPVGQRVHTPPFSQTVFLSHTNDPNRVPLFPGDPEFTMTTAFTVAKDGFYLQEVHEGEHTGTHYSAPCHFHVRELCAGELDPADFILPAVVIDIRAKVRNDVDYHVTVTDLQKWQKANGPFPKQAAVLLWTGCDKWWGPEIGGDIPTYYNCGSGHGRFRQPGFSKKSVLWLIDQGVLGYRGALGSDTFGPDPGDDPNFVETWLTLRRHRFTIENMTNLDAMPTTGGWVLIGGPRNRHGSGAPSSIFGLIP
jgi:kynurenine formamidase